MWLSAKGDTKGWVEFDFAAPQKLSTICIWNYNDTWHTDRGVRTANISVWTQDGGWKTIRTGLPCEQAEGGDGYDEPTVVTLDAVAAQKVRFDNFTSLGDTDCVGLSNVQFFQPRGPQAIRPYPPDGADDSGAGSLELAWSAGEGAKAHNVYAGTSPDDLKLLGKVEQTGAKLSNLKTNSKYCWRVDEVQADGSAVTGKVWSFTTGGLVGWWKLDEAEGTKAADSSGKGYDGIIHGDPKWLPTGGKVGGALQFDGVDDYVDTNWAQDLPTWTVAVWVTSPAAPSTKPCSGPMHREANFQLNWSHDWDPYRSAAACRVGDIWQGASFGELRGNTWYHLAATYDGENIKSYKDGVLITDNSAPSGPPFPEPKTMTIAKNASHPFYFAGTVDEVCVFTGALSADEIKSLYSGKFPSEIGAAASSSGPRLARPGAEATKPYPADGANGAGVGDLELTWSAGNGAQAHNVYVGTNPDDLKLLGRVEQARAHLSGLERGNRYCWRVDEMQADGSTVPGRVWSFTAGGLAGWWKLDEAEGTKVADSSGNGHDGIIHGDPKWLPASGKIRGALRFDGVDDYVDTGWTENLPAWTVAVWVTSPAAPASGTPGSGPVHRQTNFQMDWNHDWDLFRGAAGLKIADKWHAVSFGDLKADTWYHLVATYDGENLKAYKDGILVADNPAPSGRPLDERETMKMGRNTKDEAYFAGTVDEVCVFTAALSADQVRALYSGQAPQTLSGPASSTGPCLVQTSAGAPVPPAAAVPAPLVAGPAPAQAQVQTVSVPPGPVAGTAGPPAAPQPRASLNLWVIVVILVVGAAAAVTVIAGVSTLAGKGQNP